MPDQTTSPALNAANAIGTTGGTAMAFILRNKDSLFWVAIAAAGILALNKKYSYSIGIAGLGFAIKRLQ